MAPTIARRRHYEHDAALGCARKPAPVGVGDGFHHRPIPERQHGERRVAKLRGQPVEYSALDQINAGNFDKLEVAWRFKTDGLGPRPEFNLQTTPLMVKGVLYLTAGTRRAAVALDGKTGEILWIHHINEGERGEAAPRQLSGRGVGYWTDGR